MSPEPLHAMWHSALRLGDGLSRMLDNLQPPAAHLARLHGLLP